MAHGAHPRVSRLWRRLVTRGRGANGERIGAGVQSDQASKPIGVFDSGFGGLSVLRALVDLLPHESFAYVGDTGRYPYGPRPLEEVAGFAHQITRFLVDEVGVKMVVVACNTASAAALDELVAEAPVPVIGVIEPGVRAVAAATSKGRVGVIGTTGTISSGAYQRASATVSPQTKLFCAACPGFVEFVERGETDSDQVHVLAERLLSPLRGKGIDSLLLACTHYPFLARTIGDVMGRSVLLVSSADETAFEVKRILESSGASAPASGVGAQVYYSSGDVEWFRSTGRRLFGQDLDNVVQVVWE